jgi:hypothetical protein
MKGKEDNCTSSLPYTTTDCVLLHAEGLYTYLSAF